MLELCPGPTREEVHSLVGEYGSSESDSEGQEAEPLTGEGTPGSPPKITQHWMLGFGPASSAWNLNWAEEARLSPPLPPPVAAPGQSSGYPIYPDPRPVATSGPPFIPPPRPDPTTVYRRVVGQATLMNLMPVAQLADALGHGDVVGNHLIRALDAHYQLACRLHNWGWIRDLPRALDTLQLMGREETRRQFPLPTGAPRGGNAPLGRPSKFKLEVPAHPRSGHSRPVQFRPPAACVSSPQLSPDPVWGSPAMSPPPSPDPAWGAPALGPRPLVTSSEGGIRPLMTAPMFRAPQQPLSLRSPGPSPSGSPPREAPPTRWGLLRAGPAPREPVSSGSCLPAPGLALDREPPSNRRQYPQGPPQRSASRVVTPRQSASPYPGAGIRPRGSHTFAAPSPVDPTHAPPTTGWPKQYCHFPKCEEFGSHQKRHWERNHPGPPQLGHSFPPPWYKPVLAQGPQKPKPVLAQGPQKPKPVPAPRPREPQPVLAQRPRGSYSALLRPRESQSVPIPPPREFEDYQESVSFPEQGAFLSWAKQLSEIMLPMWREATFPPQVTIPLRIEATPPSATLVPMDESPRVSPVAEARAFQGMSPLRVPNPGNFAVMRTSPGDSSVTPLDGFSLPPPLREDSLRGTAESPMSHFLGVFERRAARRLQMPPVGIPAPQMPPVEIPAPQMPPVEIPASQMPPVGIPAPQMPPVRIPAPQVPPVCVPAPWVPPVGVPAPWVPPVGVPAPRVISTLHVHLITPVAPQVPPMSVAEPRPPIIIMAPPASPDSPFHTPCGSRCGSPFPE
jgi:hypothetical protein